jgi:hypothetical protein
MRKLSKEQAIDKAKNVYWVCDIIYGKLKKDQKENEWYGISLPKCWEDFYHIDITFIKIKDAIDSNYHRSQIIILK